MPTDAQPTESGRRELAQLVAGASSGRRRRHSDGELQRRWTSRQLHRLGDAAAHAWAGAAVAGIAVVWVAFGALLGFPQWWLDVLSGLTSTVTLVMLFALHHLQTRDQTAVQRKLDEILRALPGADTTLVAVEDAPDETLRALTHLDRVDRQQ